MPRIILALLVCAAASACSVRKFAMGKVASALASGGSTFESDDDLTLVGSALPFGLKLYESLLAENPRHKELLLATCRGFAGYSYTFVHNEADRVAEDDLARARPMHLRARRLYQRALDYCYQSLDVAYAGIGSGFPTHPREAARRIRGKADVPSLYWTAVALGLAISVSKNDTDMLARVPEVEALIGRALELDEGWNEGALHEFQITFAGAKPGDSDYEAMTRSYRRALDLSAGQRAGVHVAYAEAWALPQQKREDFDGLLKKALAVDASRPTPGRLLNILAHDRARWLLGRIDELIAPSRAEGGDRP